MIVNIFITLCLNGVCHTTLIPYNGEPDKCEQASYELLLTTIPKLKEGETVLKFGCEQGDNI